MAPVLADFDDALAELSKGHADFEIGEFIRRRGAPSF
jgi:hypothetical protein